ncbi:MAG: hypothetical protein FWD05_09660 [Oscillospiraceae bacterium]|nr:hypothetical protein [Oscillospiraceae bacterium]
MSEIFVNNSGVQSQSGAVFSSTNVAEQSNTNYTSQSNSHQGELDGVARLNTLRVSNYARQAVSAACETSHNLRVFIGNASQTTVSVDQSQSQRFHTDS